MLCNATCITTSNSKIKPERHLKSANLRQRYVNFSPGGSTTFGNGKRFFNPILDPDADPDQHQNLTTTKLGQVQPSPKIPAKSPSNFLRNPADKRTNS